MMQPQGPDGVLLVDKAPGMTSHDVVAIVRRALNTKKVGHCGTLDPLATGLLIVVLGRGTKIPGFADGRGQGIRRHDDPRHDHRQPGPRGPDHRKLAGAAGHRPREDRRRVRRIPRRFLPDAADGQRDQAWAACRSTNWRARARRWSARRVSSTCSRTRSRTSICRTWISAWCARRDFTCGRTRTTSAMSWAAART